MKKTEIEKQGLFSPVGTSVRAQAAMKHELREFRKLHPEISIILSEEKIEICRESEIREAIEDWVLCIKKSIDQGKLHGHGYDRYSEINLIIVILKEFYRFTDKALTHAGLYCIVEEILRAHRKKALV